MFLPDLRNDFGKVIYFPVGYDPGVGYLELGKKYDVENFKLSMSSDNGPAPFSCFTDLPPWGDTKLYLALSGTGVWQTNGSRAGTVTLDCGLEDKYFLDNIEFSYLRVNPCPLFSVDGYYDGKSKSIRLFSSTVYQSVQYIVTDKYALGVTGFSRFVFTFSNVWDFTCKSIILSEGRGGNPNLVMGPQVINGDNINNYRPYLCISKGLPTKNINYRIL